MSEGFRRGSTPTNIFNVNIDLTGATVFVTYSQNNKVVIEKTGNDLTVSSDKIETTLSQTDTLALQSGRTEIQIRYVMSNGTADASNIIVVDAQRILKDGVITHV